VAGTDSLVNQQCKVEESHPTFVQERNKCILPRSIFLNVVASKLSDNDGRHALGLQKGKSLVPNCRHVGRKVARPKVAVTVDAGPIRMRCVAQFARVVQMDGVGSGADEVLTPKSAGAGDAFNHDKPPRAFRQHVITDALRGKVPV